MAFSSLFIWALLGTSSSIGQRNFIREQWKLCWDKTQKSVESSSPLLVLDYTEGVKLKDFQKLGATSTSFKRVFFSLLSFLVVQEVFGCGAYALVGFHRLVNSSLRFQCVCWTSMSTNCIYFQYMLLGTFSTKFLLAYQRNILTV